MKQLLPSIVDVWFVLMGSSSCTSKSLINFMLEISLIEHETSGNFLCWFMREKESNTHNNESSSNFLCWFMWEKESSIHTTLGDSKEKCIISINEIHERENRGIIRKLEKPSTKPMNAEIHYKKLKNNIMNLFFFFFFSFFSIYALSDLLVKSFFSTYFHEGKLIISCSWVCSSIVTVIFKTFPLKEE